MELFAERRKEAKRTINFTRLSVVGYVLILVTLLFLLYFGSIFFSSTVVSIFQFCAIALMVWARLTFGRRSFHLEADATEGGLVTRGPYRFIRHPIYASILCFVWAGIIGNLTLMNILLGIGIVAGVWMRVVSEERLVVEKYPEYAEYSRRTKRLIPFLF